MIEKFKYSLCNVLTYPYRMNLSYIVKIRGKDQAKQLLDFTNILITLNKIVTYSWRLTILKSGFYEKNVTHQPL